MDATVLHDRPALVAQVQGSVLRPVLVPGEVIRVTVPPARPPEIAEREEFDDALRTGTPAALQLFIARHPESRWRPEAEQRLRALQNAPDQR